jgi:hypothetical protein
MRRRKGANHAFRLARDGSARLKDRPPMTAGSAALVLLALPSGPAGASSAAKAQLTGTFSVVIRGTAPKAVRGTQYQVNWSFTPECDTGACAVSVDTLASSCVSGSCPQPPSAFSFAGAQLALSHGTCQGSFSVKTGCTVNGNYWPYAYKQHTTLTLSPTAARHRRVHRIIGPAQCECPVRTPVAARGLDRDQRLRYVHRVVQPPRHGGPLSG